VSELWGGSESGYWVWLCAASYDMIPVPELTYMPTISAYGTFPTYRYSSTGTLMLGGIDVVVVRMVCFFIAFSFSNIPLSLWFGGWIWYS